MRKGGWATRATRRLWRMRLSSRAWTAPLPGCDDAVCLRAADLFATRAMCSGAPAPHLTRIRVKNYGKPWGAALARRLYLGAGIRRRIDQTRRAQRERNRMAR